MFYMNSVPFKDHYILWFPNSTLFLAETTNFTKQSSSTWNMQIQSVRGKERGATGFSSKTCYSTVRNKNAIYHRLCTLVRVEHLPLTRTDFSRSKLNYNKISRTIFRTSRMVQILFGRPAMHSPFSEHPSNLFIYTINDTVSLFTCH